MKGKRVAIVCREASGFGGTTTTIVEHARRLSALGCGVDVYGWKLDRERLREAGAAPMKVHGFSFGGTLKRKLFAWAADRATARGYDVVHGHGDNYRQDVLSLHNCVHAAHEAVLGTPVDDSRGVAFIHAKQLRERRFKKLIANSRLMRADVIERFGVPEKMIEVIYPGHDPRRFKAADKDRLRERTRRELGFAPDELVFGLITSGDFVKRGVNDFVAALGLVARAKIKLKALVMGKEAKLGPYLREAGQEGLQGALTFQPAAADVERFYHALDVYVHPARFEEFGQSLQEALACVLPVVTTARVGAAELLSGEAREGIVERVGPAALAETLARFATDEGLRARLTRLAPSLVAGNTWDANFTATLKAYSAVIENRA